MKTRDLIIICITAIILLSIGAFMVFNSDGGETTVLNMTSSPILNEGDSIAFRLSDEDEKAISNQRIEINITHEDGVIENFTLKTNSKGECKLEDVPAGNFSFIAKYYGNKKYKESSISGDLTVNKKKPEASSSNPSNKSSDSSKSYKSDYKVDDIIDGWDPSEHEVSREDLGDGNTRISYDDGYFRIVDKDGNILTYGY